LAVIVSFLAFSDSLIKGGSNKLPVALKKATKLYHHGKAISDSGVMRVVVLSTYFHPSAYVIGL
jgi:hypothetical protein